MSHDAVATCKYAFEGHSNISPVAPAPSRACQTSNSLRVDADRLVFQEKEKTLKDMTDMAQRQKERVAALHSSRSDLAAQLAATNPQQAARLQSEVLQLRETIGGLEVYKVRGTAYPSEIRKPDRTCVRVLWQSRSFRRMLLLSVLTQRNISKIATNVMEKP